MTMPPSGEKDVCRSGAGAGHQARGLFGGSQGSRLSRTEKCIPDSIVVGDSVSISPTADLMIPKNISNLLAFRTRV